MKERTRRPRKMYGIDPALIRATAGGTDNRGLLLENVVFLELMRRRKIVHYYADPHGKHEVDFVSRDPETNAVELIQVCFDLSRAETQERELRGLLHAASAFQNLPDENLLLLTSKRFEKVNDCEASLRKPDPSCYFASTKRG